MTTRPLLIEGRVWPVVDGAGNFIADVDTDQIYHNAHLAVTDIAQMGQYAFGNLEGWKDFPARAKPGDILAVGRNFGAGSSRQHAVDCFLALGIAAIVGVSFAGIYKRNAINAGWPLLECPALPELNLAAGDLVRLDLAAAQVTNVTKNITVPAKKFSQAQRDIYFAGGLLTLAATK